MTESALKKSKQAERALSIVNHESTKLFIRLVATVGILIALVLVFGLKKHATAPANQGNFAIAALAGHAFKLDVADTPALRERGLSGRTSLADREGMLFKLQEPDKQCFWMKDMKVNLDILWFDADKKLIYQQQNVAPGSYPQRYCPPSPALYVVEIKPGIVQLKLGDPLVLQKQ